MIVQGPFKKLWPSWFHLLALTNYASQAGDPSPLTNTTSAVEETYDCGFQESGSVGFETASQILQTDTSGTWGCVAPLYPQWFQLQCPEAWSSVAIMIKELVPIVLACAGWGPENSPGSVG